MYRPGRLPNGISALVGEGVISTVNQCSPLVMAEVMANVSNEALQT